MHSPFEKSVSAAPHYAAENTTAFAAGASPVESKGLHAASSTVHHTTLKAPHSARRAFSLNSKFASSTSLQSDADSSLVAAAAAAVTADRRAARRAHRRTDGEGNATNSDGSESDGGCGGHSDQDSGVADEFNAMGNGCGEAVSPPSSCADVLLLGPSLAATAKPAEWSLQSFPNSSTLVAVEETGRGGAAPARAAPTTSTTFTAAAPRTQKPRPASFAVQAMEAITQHAAATAAPANASGSDSSNSSTAVAAASASASADHSFSSMHELTTTTTTAARVVVVAGEDPIGVRQLYSLPHSLVGGAAAAASGAASPSSSLPRRVSANGVQKTEDVFSMERFATFYEVALEELMGECERRVANAPAAWRDSQRRLIRGDSNRDLATSTLSFDSPRSSGMSPVSTHGATFSAAAVYSPNGRAYPPCFPNAAQNTHGLHTRELSASFHGAARAISAPPPLSQPPAPPRTLCFSAAGQARQAEVAAEETVPALLAALGRHHGKMAPMVFIAALAYLARVTVQCASEFLSITHANWYRLTTTAILVAAKVYDEHSSTRLNAHFARSSGIPLAEMTKLELDFLYLIDFDLLLKEADVEQWLTWMETLAVRRDLMTPLQTYFVHGAESTTTTTTTTIIAHGHLSSTSLTLPESIDKERVSTTAATSRTAGLSSDAAEATATTLMGGSPLAAPVSRAFTHTRVASNTVFLSKDGPANMTAPRRVPGAVDTPGGVSACDVLHSAPLSPASSLMMPHSLLEGAPRSTLSGVSLPGSGVTPAMSLRAAGVPPSPIHGVLPACPPPQQTRLFSVVHGKREPPSPRSVRQLSRLGASPPSPLQPPTMEPHSPVGFFKQPHGSHGHHPHHQSQRSTTSGHGLSTAEPSLSRLPKPPLPRSSAAHSAASGGGGGGGAGALAHSTTASDAALSRPQVGHAPFTTSSSASAMKSSQSRNTGMSGGALYSASSTTATSTAAAAAAASTSAGSSSGGGNTRWGPFGMVQQVRDVIGVTASLVRGQLNVLAPAKAPEEPTRPQSRPVPNSSASLYHMNASSNNNTSHNTSGSNSGSAQRGKAPASTSYASAEMHRSNSAAYHDPYSTGGYDGAAGGSGSRNGRRSAPAEFAGATTTTTTTSAIAAVVSPQPSSPGRRSNRRRMTGSPGSPGCQRSPGARRDRPATLAHHADPRSLPYRAGADAAAGRAGEEAEYEEEGEYYYEDEEEGEYYEEDEYGYYGEDGYYYTYEEGEEGEYYYEEEGEDEEGWYGEEEEEEEAEYFQRCRPPLTHSPPSL